MKIRKLFLVGFSVLTLNAVGCDGDDGAQGPAGPAGSPGPAGDDGAAGAPGIPGADGADAGGFAFRTDPEDAYTVVDRMGMPAINTAVITSKDDYNAATPIDDANGDFVAEITANVDALHQALDDDLTGAGLTPCSTADCVAAAAPLVVPDTLSIDRTNPPGFPNGRLLPDPVVDVTLALVLLDLGSADGCGGDACTVTTLADLPLNPP
ncbi:MAG: DUF4331 family protein, partial [Myxococcota bacterium]